jgi:hypothetical protein
VLQCQEYEAKKDFHKLQEKNTNLFKKAYSSELHSDPSAETLKARKAWNDTFQALTVNNCHSRLLYKPKLSLKLVEKKELSR